MSNVLIWSGYVLCKYLCKSKLPEKTSDVICDCSLTQPQPLALSSRNEWAPTESYWINCFVWLDLWTIEIKDESLCLFCCCGFCWHTDFRKEFETHFRLLGFPAFALQGNRGPSRCETVLATNWCNIRIIWGSKTFIIFGWHQHCATS